MDCGDKYFLLDTIHNLNKIQYIENILSLVGNVAEYTRQKCILTEHHFKALSAEISPLLLDSIPSVITAIEQHQKND